MAATGRHPLARFPLAVSRWPSPLVSCPASEGHTRVPPVDQGPWSTIPGSAPGLALLALRLGTPVRRVGVAQLEDEVPVALLEASLELGEEVGFIKFGSRIDVFLPLGSEVHVGLEQKVKGRETVLATLPK